jgi:hypothetical protein
MRFSRWRRLVGECDSQVGECALDLEHRGLVGRGVDKYTRSWQGGCVVVCLYSPSSCVLLVSSGTKEEALQYPEPLTDQIPQGLQCRQGLQYLE